jgi:hypothetical protein
MATILQFPAPIPDPASDVSQYGACLLRVGIAAGAMASIGADELAAAMTPEDYEAELSGREHVAGIHARIERATGRTAAGVTAILTAAP